ncbi:MAG: hypothetical protein HZC40_01935 [Chloroflexi bacterium]|nr:hypothetical protein [Chloroflexota bacterium]
MKFPKGSAGLYPLLVVLLAVFAVAPLEYPGAFQSHTGLLAYYNLIALDQNPLQFFSWMPTLGRAPDLFRSDGALPYFIALIFSRLGFGYLGAIKLVYALAWIASGLTMFALARKFFSDAGAMLAAVVYIYLPFHIATVYVRGAFAESVAWAIFPVALLSVVSRQSTAVSQQSSVNKVLRFTFYALPFALLYLTQPGIAILFALVAFAIAFATRGRTTPLSQSQRDFQSLNFSIPIFSGLAFGALLTLPAILRNNARILRDGFEPNFVLPFQLFSSLWGFGASTGNFLDQFPLQIGIAPLGLAIIAIALGWHANDERSGERSLQRIIAMFLAVALVLIALTFEITSPIWNVLGIFVAAPWQLLAFVGLAFAFVAGAVIEFDPRFARPMMLAFFVALPVVASYGYLAPKFLDVKPTRPQIAIFGNNEIALLDYRIVGPLRHGATLRVHLTWQALRPIYNDYTVFVQAVHENGNTYGQSDNKPQDGSLPTIKWQAGQVINDMHAVQIDVEGPSEGFYLQIGLYKSATGERALITAGADSLRVPRPGDPDPVITDQLLPGQK